MHLILKSIPLFAALALAACANKHTGPLIADARSPISDVPVPAGFSMADNSTSRVVPANSLRVVDHYYKGSDDILSVVEFYRTQLPKHDWVVSEQSQTPGKEVTLHVTKRTEQCYVTVTKKTFDTQIRIRIDPLPRPAQ
jgi:hypothetical protein